MAECKKSVYGRMQKKCLWLNAIKCLWYNAKK